MNKLYYYTYHIYTVKIIEKVFNAKGFAIYVGTTLYDIKCITSVTSRKVALSIIKTPKFNSKTGGFKNIIKPCHFDKKHMVIKTKTLY